MMNISSVPSSLSIRITFIFALLLLPLLASAQALITFDVVDLEAYNRSGNWIYDADGPAFATHDGDWFTYSAVAGYPFHYYGEKFIHDNGTTTALTCIAENVPLATDPSQLDMTFTEFNMVAFKRINTVDPLAPWITPGQSGDERVYANATGYITYNGVQVLKINFATFVITTPYPNQAQIRALSPLLTSWVGDIGSGAPQTGYGFGDLDVPNCDPAWAALFAASNYKVQMNMVGITSTVNQLYGWFDFDLEVLPAPTPFEANNAYLNLAALPQSISFPLISAGLEVTAATPAGQYNDMQHVYLNEIAVTPTGALPQNVAYTCGRYWELGTTLNSVNLNISFDPDPTELPGIPANWRVLYRYSALHPWTVWNDYTLTPQNLIIANNVTQIGEFTVASLQEDNVPFEMASFTAAVTATSTVQLTWTTQSESQMIGYRVYRGTSNEQAAASMLDHPLIPATNSSTSQTYSITDAGVQVNNTYYYWLEALDYQNSEYYGPVSVTVLDNGVPPLPAVTRLNDAYPNPFKSSTSITVDLKEGENGTVTIYNLYGQAVRSFAVGQGSHTITWNGLDSRGKACGSGIYFYKLSTSTFSQTKRMVIVK